MTAHRDSYVTTSRKAGASKISNIILGRPSLTSIQQLREKLKEKFSRGQKQSTTSPRNCLRRLQAPQHSSLKSHLKKSLRLHPLGRALHPISGRMCSRLDGSLFMKWRCTSKLYAKIFDQELGLTKRYSSIDVFIIFRC